MQQVKSTHVILTTPVNDCHWCSWYCALIGLPAFLMRRLPLIFNFRHSDHVSDALISLHRCMFLNVSGPRLNFENWLIFREVIDTSLVFWLSVQWGHHFWWYWWKIAGIADGNHRTTNSNDCQVSAKTDVNHCLVSCNSYVQSRRCRRTTNHVSPLIMACTYKLFYKPWALSMGEGDFRPSTAPRPLNQFSWNFKYITISRTWPQMQNLRGATSTWVVWANSQFVA